MLVKQISSRPVKKRGYAGDAGIKTTKIFILLNLNYKDMKKNY